MMDMSRWDAYFGEIPAQALSFVSMKLCLKAIELTVKLEVSPNRPEMRTLMPRTWGSASMLLRKKRSMRGHAYSASRAAAGSMVSINMR